MMFLRPLNGFVFLSETFTEMLWSDCRARHQHHCKRKQVTISVFMQHRLVAWRTIVFSAGKSTVKRIEVRHR